MLRLATVPQCLRHLIPLAERFGIIDAGHRERLVSAETPSERARLKSAVSADGDNLDVWLDGPESLGPAYSAEFLAFNALRMAAGTA